MIPKQTKMFKTINEQNKTRQQNEESWPKIHLKRWI